MVKILGNIHQVFMILVLGVLLIPIGLLLYALLYYVDKKWYFGKYYSRVWSFILIKMNPLWSLKIEGKEKIDKKKTYVIVANHNAFADIPMMHFLPLNFRWVSKQEVLKFPVIGVVLRIQRSIVLKRGDPNSAKAMLTKGDELLKNGICVSIFPEGTRSKTGDVGKFKPGAFLMAKSAGVEVLPVMLYNARETKHGAYHRVKLRVKILDPVDISKRKLSEFSQELNQVYINEFNGTENSGRK